MGTSDESPIREPLHADKEQWSQFLSYFLLATGIAFTVAGSVFFFAYNWEELPKLVKIGLVELSILITVSLVLFAPWSKPVKQIILTGAAFLVGTLFAVFGQIYQTGADAYDLFLVWTLFILLWTIAARFALLWLTFIVLLCTTFWLYAMQIVSDNEWQVMWIGNTVTWICAVSLMIAEWMDAKQKLTPHNDWFITIIGIATVVHTSCMLILAILENEGRIFIPFATTFLLFAGGLWYGWKRKKLFYFGTIPFAALVILLSLIIRNSGFIISDLFLLTLIATVGTTSIVYAVVQLKKKWHETEE